MQELLEQGKELEVHTKTYWQEKGKKPKEGIEGIKTKLWKKKGEEDKYFLVNATLFSERGSSMENDKVEVIIEETISQTFLVAKNNLERIEEMYKNGELVLDNPEVHSVAYTYDDLCWITIK